MSARNMAKRTAAGTLALAVCLGGGAIALASAASADANFKFDNRISGDDRYGTAVAASKAAFDKADNVILVNGYATVDGLTASYLAGVANAPILYVSDKGADDQTKAEIKRLGAKNIWLVGGEKVIPASVADAIKGDGYTVTRINGSDRYETAALIAEAGIKISGKKPSTVFVASGTSFADALAVSPVAFVKGYPIILTDKDSTSDFSKKELGVIGTDSKVLVGGTAVVSDKVAADLSIKSDARVAGDDRAVTANKISDWAKKTQGFNPANAALVGGTNGNGADSLVAAPLLGKSFTTLHFAGWDATATYMKDHSAELTGKGFIFGGKAAVSDGQVSSAQSAAQSAAAAVGQIVTAYSNTSFSVADAASQGAKKYTLKSTDKYVVSGSAATQGAFVASLAVGATVSVSVAGDVATYTLVPVSSTGFSSGLVGAYDTSAKTFSVVEPITGTKLPFLSASATSYNYTTGGAFVNYTVDGQSVSQGIFEGAISYGDTVSVKGTGADLNNIRTVALTSGSISGTVASVTGSSPITAFTVKSTAGATFTIPLPTTGDAVSIDGTASTSAAFTGAAAVTGPPAVAAVVSPVSVGDQVTYAKAGGVQKVTLVNAAPSKLAGMVADSVTISGTPTATNSTQLAYWSPAGTASKVTYADVSRFIVDGTVASKADFVAAATAGDAVVYQPADTTTNTTSSLTLTSKPLAGTVAVGDVDSSGHHVSVVNADGDTIATQADYSSATSVYATGTGNNVYTIDGTTSTLAQFDAMVNRIQTGARQGSVQASISNGTVTWTLSTMNFTAAPAPVSITKGASNVVVVTFNKPVTPAGSAAFSDWTITGAGTATAVAWTANNTVATFTGTAITTGTVTVTPLNATKAALYTDTYGTTVGTGSISATF
ncbi:Putative cell wall-binding protein [Quadrisphaera granulorum]|uniref:Putative cell wall-binding protein n=1 Tax=Quadrisphaera granulorum TaxID=317664 RepID=A0A316A7N6_9ACTN|nr:cell wall-binding repeat-containing protein [Quadrisphaera granulorum]PWJ52834.1 putative cell wall-binding protein [Quadrisphaera granulorum]SZE97439.1 Putative cell wall-binding protein [Quadrisphaera granulorum]